MNKLIISILFVVTTVSSWGQAKKIQHNPGYDTRLFHMGFTIAFNSLDYRILPAYKLLYQSSADSVYRVECHQTVGINLGIISDLRLHKNLNVRFTPGLIFGQRNLVYTMRKMETEPSVYEFYEYPMEIQSIYLDAPLTIKFSANRINNYRPYIIAGVAVKYDLETKRVIRQNKEYTIEQIPLDYFYEFGVGIDWYLVYFKLCTELKWSYGTKNILIHENIEYSKVIDELRSRMFVLSLHFE
ncbi:MAG TPA: porin family protein [Bacteroidales bacterium]|nr:MAG: hypothetical protein BWY22_01806 [Bacteroidetes bacterium ADurb.Bin217]HPM12240.1 porin family protein [Bacteroidales bacterium]